MAAEGQEIPVEVKAEQIPHQEDGADDEVGLFRCIESNSTLCSRFLGHFFHTNVAYFFSYTRHTPLT